MQSAGLLAKLEEAGWSRRVFWTFLRNTVEQAGLVTQEEKDAFARVMDVMNSHYLLGWLINARRWRFSGGGGGSGEVQTQTQAQSQTQTPSRRQQLQQKIAEEYASRTGFPIVQVPEDSLTWIFQRGAVLVPSEKVEVSMAALSRSLPMWVPIRKERDLEKGLGKYWQVFVASPQVFPWI
ncbi:hypothetical protein VTK56DRAFT_6294 [Thermocarpiscus australiensis]